MTKIASRGSCLKYTQGKTDTETETTTFVSVSVLPLNFRSKGLLLWVSRLKAEHWAYEVSTFSSRFAGQRRLPIDLLPGLEQKYDWCSFVLEAQRKLPMHVSVLWHLENKLWQVCFSPLPFVHAVVLPPGPRLWSNEPYYDFVRFQTKWASTHSLNRLRLETNYELMIWSLSLKIILCSTIGRFFYKVYFSKFSTHNQFLFPIVFLNKYFFFCSCLFKHNYWSNISP